MHALNVFAAAFRWGADGFVLAAAIVICLLRERKV